MKYINFSLDNETVSLIDIDAKLNQRSRTSQIIFIIKKFYSSVKEMDNDNKKL